MSSLQIWEFVVSFALVLVVTLVLKKWSPRLSYGIVGLVLIILPGTFAFFSPHNLTVVEALGPVIGTLILGADLSGRFRRTASAH